MKGIIKFYKQQGYGFIAGEDNKDYFFHISNVDQQYKQDIKNGQPVLFVPLEVLQKAFLFYRKANLNVRMITYLRLK